MFIPYDQPYGNEKLQQKEEVKHIRVTYVDV